MKISNMQKIKHFKKKVLEYRKDFGLFDWEICILEQRKGDARASCNFNIAGRIASIFYSIWWIDDKKTTLQDIEETAFHEVAELFLAELRVMLEYRYSYEVVDAQMHRIIRFMENKFF